MSSFATYRALISTSPLAPLPPRAQASSRACVGKGAEAVVNLDVRRCWQGLSHPTPKNFLQLSHFQRNHTQTCDLPGHDLKDSQAAKCKQGGHVV